MARSPSRKRSRDPWALIPDNLRWATDVALGLEFYLSDLGRFTIGADGLATQFDPGYPLERLYRKRLIFPAHLVNVFMAATFDILGEENDESAVLQLHQLFPITVVQVVVIVAEPAETLARYHSR